MFRSILGALAALLVTVGAGAAAAQEAVVNGGFEAGLGSWTPTGWGLGGSGFSGVDSAATGCGGAPCLNVGGNGQIYQDVVTVPGQAYTFSFWYRTGALNPPLELQALISNGVPVSGGAGVCNGNCVFQTQTGSLIWLQVTQNYVATSALTRITFLGRDDPNVLFIDDVSLAAVPGPASAVPTMSEWAMILFALILAGGTVVMIQRRRLTA